MNEAQFRFYELIWKSEIVNAKIHKADHGTKKDNLMEPEKALLKKITS